MPTKPALDGDNAKAIFSALGADAADLLEALADMNDAVLKAKNKDLEAYWKASTNAARNAAFITRILELLARGEYNEARRRLGLLKE